MMGQIDASIAQSNALHDSLVSTAADLEQGRGTSQDSRQRTKDAITPIGGALFGGMHWTITSDAVTCNVYTRGYVKP